jgi:hypothetical protein
VTRRQKAVLAVLVVVAFGVRLACLLYALNTPGYVWEDPDRYRFQARRLVAPDGWRWSFGAVTYVINGQRHALPPLYSVFLSVFLLFPGFPRSAQVAQVVLGALATLPVFFLGRRIHSVTAGLVAATAYALWMPGILNVWSTSQETLYIPILLSCFVLLLRAIDRDAGPLAFALAGVMFSAAALTRSMPLFFMLPAACTHVLLARDRRRAGWQGAALLAGFLLVIVPYTIGLSRYFGQLTIVDTHGSIHVNAPAGQRAPGIVQTAAQLWRAFAAQPAGFVRGCLLRARSLLHVNGGRQLQIYIVARDKVRALMWKAAVHGGTDALLAIASIGAAFGAVLCRRPALAALCVLWTAVNVGIASVGGFSGARLRVPFEPFLFVLAAVVFAGEWKRPHAVALAAAGTVAAIAAFAVLPQIPNSLGAWPDYGVRWPSIFDRRVGVIAGPAGLNAPAYDGVATLRATLDGKAPLLLQVRAGGVQVRTTELPPGDPVPIRALWPARGLAFIELAFNGGNRDSAVRLEVEGR